MRKLRMSLAIASLFAMSACASMTSTEKGTLGGAAIGGLAGAALTGGSALGTVGGAAVGGVIGHEIGQDRDRRRGY
jgi:osmotically inducible lipoprotein OsmB